MRLIAGLVSAGTCAVLVLASGCGAEPATGKEPATTVTVEEPPGTTEPPAAAEEPPAEQPPADEPQAADQWVMPDLTGATLQDAQDQIQALTAGAVFLTDSHDLGGQDRNQVVDRNWQVCTQNIAPGAPLTAESQVDFGVVKLGEACP